MRNKMATPEQERFLAQYRFQGPGKRVKPRVRRVVALFSLALMLLLILSLICLFVLFGCLERRQVTILQHWQAQTLTLLLVPLLVSFLGRIFLSRIFVWIGWLSPEEGRDVTWMVNTYPPSCWEPHDDLQTNTPEPPEQDEPHKHS